MNKITFTEPLLVYLREQWLAEAAEAGLDEERLFLLNSNFDHIISSQLFGNYTERANLSTFFGIQDDAGIIVALVEVIKAKTGPTETYKLMSIDLSPAIEVLDKDGYDAINAKVLASCVANFLKEHASSGCTKIYARNDATLEYLTKLHVGLATSQALEELNLTVQFEGPRWLAFRFKN